MSEFNRAAIVIHRAERVASGAEGHDFCFLRNQSLKVAPVKLAGFGIHLCDIQSNPAFDDQRLPGRNVRMMLEFGDDDLIAWTKRAAEGPREVINHRCRVGTEDDFVRRCSKKKIESVPRG